MRHTAALIMLLLVGCQKGLPAKVDMPEVVRVQVKVYVPIPAELDKDCDQYVAKEQTYSEAKRLALLRGASIDECNARAAKRRALQAKGTEG